MMKKIYKKAVMIGMVLMMVLSSTGLVFAGQWDTSPDDLDDGHTHTASTIWSSDGTYHWHVCLDQTCQAVLDKAAHTWDSGVETKPATTTTTGVKTFTCTVCGAKRTERLLKVNPLKVSLQSKTYKASKLKKSSKSFTVKVSKNVGKLSTSRNEAAKKAKIKIKKVKAKSGTKKYKVMIPKKCKKGIYEVNINAAGGNGYQAGSKTVRIVVK